jgi:phthiodiolone/phenolphthiodiolone dimycocerosates ketoreductase
MTGFRVGVADPIIAARPTAEAFTRGNYLGALTNGADSFWVPDHLNQLFPRSLWKEKYCGATKLLPTLDACMEPWVMLGHIAARNRLGRMRLGVAVTDSGRRNPAVTAQAAATLHLLTRGRAVLGIGPGEREGNEPYGVDWAKPVARFEEAMATIRALWDSGGELVNRDSPYFPLRNALFELPPIGASGPSCGSQRMVPACFGQRVAMGTVTSPPSLTDRRTMRNAWKRFGRLRPTRAAIRRQSPPPYSFSLSPVGPATTSMRRWTPS